MRSFDEEYNTQRPNLILKEYGRNIQKLAQHLVKIDDIKKRTDYAEVVIDMMRAINPNVNENPEYDQKLWDDLIIASAFQLDINGPFPAPEKENLFKKPQRLGYSEDKIRYKHYGRSIELLIQKAIAVEDPEEKQAFVNHIARLMKTFYGVWNKEVTNDEVIYSQIKELSKGKLEVSIAAMEETDDLNVLYKDKSNNYNKGHQKKHYNNKKSNKKYSNQNKQRRRH